MGLNTLVTARRIIQEMSDAVLLRAKSNLALLATDKRRAQALRDDIRIQIIDVGDEESEAEIITDFYWAIYYHDGRGPIKAAPGKFLVFYRNPDDDPRIDKGARNYPRRATDIRKLRLSKGEFSRLKRQKKLIATKRVKLAGGHPFLEQGFGSLQALYGPKVSAIFSQCVVELLDSADLLDGEESITFSL